MRNYIKILAAAVVAFGMSSCEDVPAPYEVDAPENGGTSTGEGENGYALPYSETFASSLGTFESVSVNGEYEWAVSYSSAQMTSYVDSQNNEADVWLVSSKVDLTSVTEAYISFKYILRYANTSELGTNYQVLISTDYDKDVNAATWQTLDFTAVSGADWSTWYEASFNVPEEYIGQSIYVALRYIANAKSATWEVKEFVVAEGSVEESGEEETGDSDGVRSLPYSETFATSFGGFKSELVSGDGEWIIDYSTAKATGYNNSVNTAGQFMLVSPQINVSEAAHITYDYILRYNRSDENQQLLISTDYEDSAAKATWTVLKANHTEGSDWSTFSNADVNVPSDMVGKVVRIAFSLTCTSDASATWEVKNFQIAAGEASGETSTEPVVTGGTSYGVVTSVVDGTYLIATNASGAYKMASNLSGKTYGYLSVADATVTNGVINYSGTTEEWTITSVSGGYTIQDASGNYLYMTGTYNSFNIDASMPSEGAVWTIAISSDGLATITNVATGKTIQYSTTYTSYGSYTDVTSTLPSLFMKGAAAAVDLSSSASTESGESSESGETSGSTESGEPFATVEGNSVTFSALGLANAYDVDGKSMTLGDATLTFSKGSGSTTPKYYTTGTAMRLYGGNTLVISSEKNITSVSFTYAYDSNSTSVLVPSDGNPSFSPDGYDYTENVWNGGTTSLTITNTASTGHFRIASITITY